jgi:hypothetical protein
VLTTCQPSTVWCSRERLPAAAAQPAKVRQSCSATYYYYYSVNVNIFNTDRLDLLLNFQSQSHVTTDGQSVSPSILVSSPLRAHDQIFVISLTTAVFVVAL